MQAHLNNKSRRCEIIVNGESVFRLNVFSFLLVEDAILGGAQGQQVPPQVFLRDACVFQQLAVGGHAGEVLH